MAFLLAASFSWAPEAAAAAAVFLALSFAISGGVSRCRRIIVRAEKRRRAGRSAFRLFCRRRAASGHSGGQRPCALAGPVQSCETRDHHALARLPHAPTPELLMPTRSHAPQALSAPLAPRGRPPTPALSSSQDVTPAPLPARTADRALHPQSPNFARPPPESPRTASQASHSVWWAAETGTP